MYDAKCVISPGLDAAAVGPIARNVLLVLPNHTEACMVCHQQSRCILGNS